WSNKKQHLTTEASPSKGPDTWREWSSDGKNLIIYWKMRKHSPFLKSLILSTKQRYDLIRMTTSSA
ncbi:LIFR isoform 4, partial [Pan troglodytes]